MSRTLHFSCEGLGPCRLSCGRLAQVIADRLRELAPPAYQLPGWQEDEAADAPPAYQLPGWREDEAAGAPPAYQLPGWREDEAAGPPEPPNGAPAWRRGAGDPSHLSDPGLWARVAELQWALASDRAITSERAARTLGRLREDGELEGVRLAVQALASALLAAHPLLQGEEGRVIVQLVALGNEMALAAAQAPDLLLYVKNELQPVDLARLLQI